MTDQIRLNEIFEKLKAIIAELEEEVRFRKTAYYDEWDKKLDDYKKDWCRVRELEMPATSLFYNKTIKDYHGIVSLLRRYFGLLRPDRIKRYFRKSAEMISTLML